MRIEVEVESLEQAREGCAAGADILLLDNMSCEQMRLVASELGSRVLLEASGGINLKTVAEVASTGVHYVSVGALTHGATSLDLSLEMEAAAS
jgi:nicotinate-nucleotide pyrophosphorylase (carboxylating)